MNSIEMTPAQKFFSKLQNDNVFNPNSIVDLSALIKLPVRKGLEQAIISNGILVNTVSKGYGHLPNELFFGEVENRLNAAGIKYVKRSINREDRSFSVDYILNDESFVVKVKNSKDRILPMIRFTNSYDGSNKSSGHFGFFREVCTNGLHVAQTKLGFSAKHRGDIIEVSMQGIEMLVNTFMENEYYTLSKKFEVLAETLITDLEGFVKLTTEKLNLFKFEKSDKNMAPSLNAQMVIDIIKNESILLGTAPTLWNGYNAMNEVLHTKLKKTFDQQANIDSVLFDTVLAMV